MNGESRRATLEVGVALVTVLGVGVLGAVTISEARSAGGWVETTLRVIALLNRAEGSIREEELLRVGTDGTAARTGALRTASENLAEARAMVVDADQLRRLDALQALLRQRALVPLNDPGALASVDQDVIRLLAELRASERGLLLVRSQKTAHAESLAGLAQALGALATVALVLLGFGRLKAESQRRQRSEEAARRSEEQLTTTLLSIGDGVIATNIHGRITKMSRVASQLTDWPYHEANGRPVSEVLQFANRPSGALLPNPLTETLRQGRSVELPAASMLVRRDGRAVPIADSCAPIIDANGGVHGAVLVFRDTTEEEHARALQERVQRQLILSDRMAAMGLLAAGVAHEINTPLAYVTSNLEMLRLELPTASADHRGLIDDARTGAERIRKIVRGLKTFSRADEDRRVEVNVSQVVDLAVDMTMAEIRHRARLRRDRGHPAGVGRRDAAGPGDHQPPGQRHPGAARRKAR